MIDIILFPFFSMPDTTSKIFDHCYADLSDRIWPNSLGMQVSTWKCIKPYLLGFIAVWHHYQQFVSWMLRQTLMLKGCRVYIPRPWEARSFIHTAHYSAPDRQYVLIRCLDFRFLELWLLGIFNIDNVYYTTLPFRAEIRFLSC